ncbi:MAG TPA: CHAT domain-containing tetratricopeptide repeat protein, partial [Pyrinomonadaceae bacterium]|nr:CHAT domain-containing tetratricopeptide repeat protein [Pyrinomonadaceae bacterium]
YAKRGRQVAEESQDYATSIRCLGLAVSMQLILGDYRQSLGSFNHAVNLAGKIPPEPKLTWPLYYEAALDFHFLGLPASALAFEQEALRLAGASGVPLLRSRTWERLGVIYGQQNKHSEAIDCGKKALAEAQNISGELSRKNISAHSMLVLGQLNLKAGNSQEAISYFDQSLALHKDLGLDTYSYQAHKGKLLALMALNDNASAEVELGTVLYWFEENRARIAEESYRNKFFDSDQNTYNVAVDFHYSRKNDAVKAFDYAEAYRARSLLDLINTGAMINGDPELPELMLSSAVAPLTLNRIQDRLPKEVQLLEYAVLEDKILMWVITKDGARSAQSSISRDELAKMTHSFRKALSGGHPGNTDEVVRQAKELYIALIGPVENYLNSSLQLCIVPDGELNFLPFAGLVSPVSQKYLVEDFTLQTSPSATIFVTSTEQAKLKEQPGPERLLIIGNPAFDRQRFTDLPDLPGAEREAVKIEEFYAANALMGNEAVAERVRQLMKDADVAHFATHAVPDERSPLLSKLLLSKEGGSNAHHASPGYLQASEIYATKLPRTRLVVLSACQTSVERAYRGEGAIGLARPFIAAGVPLVIASLWPVESEGAADLMISFHRHRKHDRLSTVEALRRAQLELIHQQATLQKNYGWAAFTAIGGYVTY